MKTPVQTSMKQKIVTLVGPHHPYKRISNEQVYLYLTGLTYII